MVPHSNGQFEAHVLSFSQVGFLFFPKSGFRVENTFSGKSTVEFKIPRLPWIHEKVVSFMCYCINV